MLPMGFPGRINDHEGGALGREIAAERVHVDAFGIDVNIIEFNRCPGQCRAIHIKGVIGFRNHDFVFRARQKLKYIAKYRRRSRVDDDIVDCCVGLISPIIKLNNGLAQFGKAFGVHAPDKIRDP